jgi:hypothetical protein
MNVKPGPSSTLAALACSALSVASAFSGQPVPVILRFSVGGANPKAPDNAGSQRNLALQFNLSGGEVWQMGNTSAPVFGAATPKPFLGRRPGEGAKQQRARRASAPRLLIR